MNFVADEGVDLQIVEILRDNGHNVIYIAETAPGSMDDFIFQFAKESNRILMTSGTRPKCW